jgi:glycosyltransferase involved in cell wall biosynthesis
MKVALVIPTYFDESSVIAGAERYAFELAKAMSRQAETTLITFAPEARVRHHGELTVEYHRRRGYIGASINPVSLGFVSSLDRVDVVHCLQIRTFVTEIAALYTRWTGKKLFATDLAGGVRYNLTTLLPVWERLDGFLPISEFNRKAHTEWTVPTSVIYGGVDTGRFTPSAAARERAVLFVGRLLPFKGIDVLIRALDIETHLHVVGQPYDDRFMATLRELAQGKQVTFHTTMSDDELIGLYQRVRATAIPSIIEGGYTTALESMACGAPVVTTDVGSLPELVEDGQTGWVVPAGDVEALHDRLNHLVTQPEQSALMGARGRSVVLERFTWENTARRCLDAYRTLSHTRAGAAA